MSKTIVEIVGKDLTGSAISSVQDKLSGLAGTALKVTASLSAIGATAAIAGLASMTKSVIDSQDELKKLSERTGLAIESLSGIKFAAEQSGAEIEKVGKAARQFSTLIADANAGNKSAIDSLNNLGIAYQKLKDSTPEDQLLALADALQKYSKEDRAIALTSILGDRMAELVPLLQNGSAGFRELVEEGKRLNPVTAESAAASERFNDNLDRLAKGAATLGISIANQILPALAGFTDRVVDAQREGNVLIGIWRGLKEVFAGTAGLDDIGKKRKEVLDINRQLQSELKPGAFGDIFKDDSKIEFLKVQLKESTKELQALIDKQTNLDRALKASDEGTKKFTASTSNSANAAKSAGRSIKGLSDEQRRLAEEQRKTQALFSEGQRLTEDLDPWIRRNNQIKRYVDLLQAGAIEQEIFNKAVAGANTDYEKAVAKLNESTEGASKSVKEIGVAAKSSFDDMSQFAIQAARNVQTAFANFFFDPFDDGLEGLVKGFGNAIRRLIAEAAALNTIQGLGLGGLVGATSGGGSTALTAISASGIANSLKSGFSAANSSLTSALGSGFTSLGNVFGSSALRSFGAGLGGQLSAFSNVGGAGTAFIGGAGTALGGTGLSGSAAAGLGSSFAAASAPILAAAIATSILKGFAGNKQIGGGFGKALNTVGNIPIIGDLLPIIPLLNGLFGRGPLKQKETNLVGNFSAEDFQGVTSTKFKAQGGLVVGDKVERVKIDTDTGKVIDDFTSKLDKFATEMSKASKEIGQFLDNSIKGISTQFRGIAKDLGLSTSAIDNFSASINIATEKGKGFTDEQLAEEIGRVADKMALELMPSLEGLGKAGESASQTLARIGSEFTVLVDAATNLGHSLAESNAFIKNVSIEARTAFVDAAGGMDSLAAKTSFFAENFLTAGEQLAPVMELVANRLKELGLSGIKTRDQFKDVVQSFGKVNGVSKETLLALLDLAPAFAQVTASIESATETALSASERQLQIARQAASADRDPRVKNKRSTLTDEEKNAKKQAGVDKELAGVEAAFKIIEAQAEIRFKKINEAITQADSFINDQIRAAEAGFSFINSLKESVADISTTSRTASKAQLDAAIQLVRITGDIKKVDTPELRNAIELLKEERTDLFSNRKDFSKDQADTARKINELAALGQSKTDETIKTLQDQLSTLKAILGAQELQTRVSLELARSQSLGVGANVGASKEESVVLSQSAGFVQALGKARLAILGAFGGSNGVGTNNLDPVTLGNFGASARQKDNIIKQALSALLEGGPNLDKTLAKLRDKFDSIGGNNPFVRDEFFNFPEVDKRTGLNAFPQFNFQTLVDELKLLRQETAANKTASQQMAALLNSVTRGGSAMVTA